MTPSLPQSRAAGWIVWMIASIFLAYQYILRVMPNILLPDIMKQFQIDAATFGQFSGIYYIGYSLMHVPLGLLLDRFGPRKVLTCCLLATVLGLVPLLFASHWSYPILGRLLIGMGSSGAVLGVFKVIRMSFKEKFTRMLSFSVTIGLMGAIYGGGPISYMHDTLGYRVVIQILAGLGLLLAIITYWITPDEKPCIETNVFSDLKEVFANRRVVLSCIMAGLMVGPLEGFADVWGTAFLKKVYGFEGALAASLPSLIFVGMCFGAPLLSLIAEKIGNLGTIIGSGALMALIFFALLFFPLSTLLITLGFIAIGIASAYQVLAIYQASTYVREHLAGLTTASANMIIMIFGYAFHSIIGFLVKANGGPENSEALFFGVAVIPTALLLAVLGYSFLAGKKRIAVASDGNL